MNGDPSRTRLCKLVTMFGVGGTERQVANLVRFLDLSRFELRMSCLKRDGYFLPDIERRGVPIGEYRITSLRNAAALRKQMAYAADLRRHGIQIAHSYNFYANVFGVPAARAARVPVVIASVRDMGVYLTPMQKLAQNLVLRLADCILVNAQAIRGWLIEGGANPQRIAVISNGIDTARFDRRNMAPGLRREFGFPQDAPLVVMLSRLKPEKGIEDFLEASARVAARCPAARFLVIGEAYVRGKQNQVDVAFREHLAGVASRHGLDGLLQFTGGRADVAEILSEASVSVLPSYSEGLSNTLLESMAAGVPVVATDVGGNPEIVRDGRGGMLVRPGDPAALAERVVAILESGELAKRLGSEARDIVRQRFSLERMVRDTQELYTRLIVQKLKAAA